MKIEKLIADSSSTLHPDVTEVNLTSPTKKIITTGCVILLNVDIKVRNFLLNEDVEYLDFDEVESSQQVFTQLLQIKGKVDAIVMGVQVKEPVSIAQRAHAINKDVPILILTEPEQHKQLQQALIFTPFLSNDVTTWSTESPDQLADILRDTIKRKQKRYKYQKSMAVVQKRLGDVPRARPQVKHYLDRLLDNVPIGVLNVDIQGSVLGLNRFASQILYRTERDVIGTLFTDFFPLSEREALRDLIAQCVAPSRQRAPIVFKIGENVGTVRYVEVIASSLVDDSGQLGATVILQDVSARVRAEKERIQAEEALRVSEIQYRELVQTMSEALVLTDEQHCITYVNDSFCHMFGYTSKEVLSKPLLGFVHKDYKEEMQKCMLNPVQGAGVQRYETAWVTKQGKKVYTLTSPKRLFDPDLGYVGCLGVFTDITERKKTEGREKKHMMELAHVSRVTTLGEMSSQIAHELAQPLAAIAALSTGSLKMLKSKTSNRDEIIESLTNISQQSSRAREVVLRLRNFVRNDEIQYTQIDLSELVRTVVHLVEMEARWHSLPVLLDLQEQLPGTSGDRILIEQVVLNLVHNAIEVMQSVEKPQRNLIIRTSSVDDATLKVEVIDSGPGISEEEIKKVFQPFYTTKPDGMGMGLAITRSIIDAHGGQLSATRNEYGGATFCFTLPAVTTEEAREY